MHKIIDQEVVNISEFSESDKEHLLESVTFTSKVRDIRRASFKMCRKISTLTFEEGVEEIGEAAFFGCENLKEVSFPKSLKRIGREAFRRCISLEKVQISDELLFAIPEDVFASCPCEAELNARRFPLLAARAAADVKKMEMGNRADTKGPFSTFWEDFTSWWGVDGDEEDQNLRMPGTRSTSKFRCRWDEGTLIAAMMEPWPQEWDYVQLYRGMFGWEDVGRGFHSQPLRKKVVKLLLKEIIRRHDWLEENPGALSQRVRDLNEKLIRTREIIQKTQAELVALEEKKGDLSEENYQKEKAQQERRLEGAENELKILTEHRWFADYRWTRDRTAGIGDGDMRLYVKGVDHLWGAPIMCQWAIRDRARN